MSETPRVDTGSETGVENDEAVVGVRSAVKETLAPAIDELQNALSAADLLEGDPELIEVDKLERLAQSVFDNTAENTPQQNLALLLLKAVRLLSDGRSNKSKIHAIMSLAYYLKTDLKPGDIEEADGILMGAGIDILPEVDGLGELCRHDDVDAVDDGADQFKSAVVKLCETLEFLMLDDDGEEDGEPDILEIVELEMAAESVWEHSAQQDTCSPREDIALMLVKGAQLISKTDVSKAKLNAMLEVAKMIERRGLIDKDVEEADEKLAAAGLDVVDVEVDDLSF